MSQQPRIIKDDDLTLGQIFLLAFKKCITFKGRASRYQYWPVIITFHILERLVDRVFHIESFIMGEILLGNWKNYVLILLVSLLGLFLVLVNVSLKARRLQDASWGGWIAWAYGIAAIAHIILESKDLLVIAFILNCIIFIVSFFKGTKGPNKYGPDLKDDVEWETRGIFKKGAFKNAKKWILRVTIVLTLVAGSITGIILSMGYFEKRKSDAFIESMAPGSFFTLKIDDSSKNPYTFGKVQNIDEEKICVQLSNYNYSHLGNTEADMNKAKATGDDLSSPITFSRKEFQDLNIQSIG